MDARLRMRSCHGLDAIDCEKDTDHKVAVIATDLTGELTPHGSVCGGSGELTRTLSALARLSAEEQTSLGRKLGQGPAAPEAVADSPFRVVLQNAVVQGDVEAVAAALKSGADPNERDDLRHSSLHFAAAKGEVACLKELMRAGARANVANNAGWSPLHYAVLGGHVDVVEALLRAGAYPTFRDNHLISPLHLASTQACSRPTFQRMAELLGPSALRARDEMEQTPLHVAASCGNRIAVAVLLEFNADPEAIDHKGRTPGQSWLRQVSQRARTDIRGYLAAAIERRAAQRAAASSPAPSSIKDEHLADSLSTLSCEDAACVSRPSSMLSLLPASWGLGKKPCAEQPIPTGTVGA